MSKVLVVLETAEGKVRAVLVLMLGVTIITIIRCVAKFYQDFLGQKIVEISINRLRMDIFRHVMRMPIGVFANDRPSDVISRIAKDTVTMASTIRVLLGKALREPMNALFMQTQFLDGRSPSLEEQAKLPPVNPVEMGQPDEASVIAGIHSLPAVGKKPSASRAEP